MSTGVKGVVDYLINMADLRPHLDRGEGGMSRKIAFLFIFLRDFLRSFFLGITATCAAVGGGWCIPSIQRPLFLACNKARWFLI